MVLPRLQNFDVFFRGHSQASPFEVTALHKSASELANMTPPPPLPSPSKCLRPPLACSSFFPSPSAALLCWFGNKCMSRRQLVGNSTSPSAHTSSGPPTTFHLKEAASVSLDGGVLDAKWCQQPVGSSGAGVLACATSTGRLVLYTLSVADATNQEEDEARTEFQRSCSSEAGDNLLLSLDWSGGGIQDAKVKCQPTNKLRAGQDTPNPNTHYTERVETDCRGVRFSCRACPIYCKCHISVRRLFLAVLGRHSLLGKGTSSSLCCGLGFRIGHRKRRIKE